MRGAEKQAGGTGTVKGESRPCEGFKGETRKKTKRNDCNDGNRKQWREKRWHAAAC